VTFDPYWGFGHAQPPKPARLLAWLEAQGRYRNAAPEDRRARLDPLVQAKQVTALAEASIADRYWQLRDLSDDPRLGFCSPSIRDAVRQALHEVARLPEAQAERGAERAFLDVTHNRNTARTLDQWRDLRDDWKTLTRMFPDTRYGKCAQRAYEEAADLCAEAEAKQQAASPDRPSTTSRPARSKQGESRRSSPKPPPPPRFR
jgi:hypothetical protein